MATEPDTILFDHLVVIGLGLLGGSVCLAARKCRAVRTITSVTLRPGTSHSEAVREGIVDFWSGDLAKTVAEANLVVLAGPVDAIEKCLPGVLTAASAETLITDVGSTKARLCATAESCASQGQFVGSHPMAGSHLVGWRNARFDLFEDRPCFVTIGEKTNLSAAARLSDFWKTLGSRIILTTPERHDQLASLVSHAPHLASAAIVHQLEQSGEDPEFLRLVVGAGFRDTTRIAMGSADIWREICQHNPEEIVARLRGLSAILAEQARQIEAGDWNALEASLASAAHYREIFNESMD